MTNKLTWIRSNSRAVAQRADSMITDDGGAALRWHLHGGGDEWGMSLAPDTPHVKDLGLFPSEQAAKNAAEQFEDALHWYMGGTGDTGGEEVAKDAAEQFEDEHTDQAAHFPRFEVVERYHFIGGGYVDRTYPRSEATHLGELNACFASRALKKLRKARRDNKVMRFITDSGIAVVPVRQITLIEVLQRNAAGEEFRGEPGWPAMTEAAEIGELTGP